MRTLIPYYFNDFIHRENYEYDVKDNENDYRLLINVPGFSKEDIKIEYNDGALLVEGAVENELIGQRDVKYRFTLPNKITVDEIKANVKNGILEIVIPKEIRDNKKTIVIT